jgi:hypothetical protein
LGSSARSGALMGAVATKPRIARFLAAWGICWQPRSWPSSPPAGRSGIEETAETAVGAGGRVLTERGRAEPRPRPRAPTRYPCWGGCGVATRRVTGSCSCSRSRAGTCSWTWSRSFERTGPQTDARGSPRVRAATGPAFVTGYPVRCPQNVWVRTAPGSRVDRPAFGRIGRRTRTS